MAPPSQALIRSILHLLLLLAASMLLAADESSAGYSFDLTHAGPNEQLHHMKLQIGKPSPVSAIADTGSDLIWLQGDKCSSDPISCPGAPCDTVNMKCCHGHCMFEREYGHSSFARGFMVESKVKPDETTEVNLKIGCAVEFGCPHVNEQDCEMYKIGGIVGLGRGDMSLLSQLGLQKKFSFCLPDYRDPKLTSKIKFGDHAAALPEEGHGQPVAGQVEFVKDRYKYYVNLKKISMGTKDPVHNIGDGVMLIDSGASFTRLPDVAFREVEKLVKGFMRGGPKKAPMNKGLTCYDPKNLPEDMPEMVLQFDSAEMRLPKERYLMLESSEVCLAITKTFEKRPTLGNFQMQNISMLFDLTKGQAGTLAFWPANCGHLK